MLLPVLVDALLLGPEVPPSPASYLIDCTCTLEETTPAPLPLAPLGSLFESIFLESLPVPGYCALFDTEALYLFAPDAVAKFLPAALNVKLPFLTLYLTRVPLAPVDKLAWD